ncbi:hypothetical protein BN2475_400054 [Paraburkholderia ribeironis]|uniref:Uncharacterized protein n=1 Tax=Paraburkholderia ribeironis TaxID=1247936 RepID=A0A1N7S6T4_9BURK|nr:hypothetical protein BN2475_400054 [Paraburkholderia ribeironis]
MAVALADGPSVEVLKKPARCVGKVRRRTLGSRAFHRVRVAKKRRQKQKGDAVHSVARSVDSVNRK